MNFFRKIKIWINGFFFGLADADREILSQNDNDDSKHISVHQVKEIQRVAPALLRGEVTQEVVDLRYRDYLISEGSRFYNSDGVRSDNTGSLMENVIMIPKKFSGINHEICNGMNDCDNVNKYTLKIDYTNSVKYLLEKYCDHFSVDDYFISLYFSRQPNRNLVTSKAFCNYISSLIQNENSEYSKLSKLRFTSYKITNVPNYTKFTFYDLILVEILNNGDELILKYRASSKNIETVLDKYNSTNLEDKYKAKSEKYQPKELVVYDVDNKCEICGKEIEHHEGQMNKAVIGKYCCGECLSNELLKMKNTI